MVEYTLVKDMIAEGARLLGALDSASVKVDAALWFYFSESEMWRLVIAIPIVEEAGREVAFRAVRQASETLDPPVDLAPGGVRVVSRNDPIIKALGGFHSPASLVGRRFGGTYVDGVVFDGAYVYRIPADLGAAARR